MNKLPPQTQIEATIDSLRTTKTGAVTIKISNLYGVKFSVGANKIEELIPVIKKEIAQTLVEQREQIVKLIEEMKLKCKRCNSNNLYVNNDGFVECRDCHEESKHWAMCAVAANRAFSEVQEKLNKLEKEE